MSPTNVNTEILKPLLEDEVLMALIKQRYVPLMFLLKKVDRKPSAETAATVVRALAALRRGSSQDAGHVLDLEVHFALVGDVLHVAGGRRRGARSSQQQVQVTMDEVSKQHLKSSLSPESRLEARNFQLKHYEELKKHYDVYQKVVRECERSVSFVEARERLKLDEAEWGKIKSWMSRFGLLRDMVYAKPLLLHGSLARELELRFTHERIDDVVPRLLRDAIEMLDVRKTLAA